MDLKAGKICDITNGKELTFAPIPEIMLGILNEGGLVPYIKKYKDFVIPTK